MKKLTLDHMRDLAKLKNGECLSKKYINAHTKLKWQCKEGHVWWAQPSNIKSGTWCPFCSGRIVSIEDLQKISKSRGGRCLSEKYINSRTKLKWQCEKGHTWETAPANVVHGSWCPYCIGRHKTIELMQEIAGMKGGKCLSKRYKGVKHKLKWQCKDGHTWFATPDKILRGRWCYICSKGISERICRKYFEAIFEKQFPNRKPKWLKNDRGNLMELDGYCEELRIAFEYQGEQHSVNHSRFRSKGGFEQRKKDDELKKKLCKLHNVILIEIPYTVEYEDMGNFILEGCRKKGIGILKRPRNLDYKLFNIYSTKKLKEMQELAKQKEGRCLSKKYIDKHSKLIWQCRENHIWKDTPDHIKGGRWCPKCHRKAYYEAKAAKYLPKLQNIARSKGGSCLSREYINAKTNMEWKCKNGHTWKATPDMITQGSWCPYCSGRRKTIKDMQRFARARDGKCLSVKYMGTNRKHKWQCKMGHTWNAIPSSIIKGHWCPYCAGVVRKTIEEMQRIANERGGECLSVEYINARAKLRWKCKEGHEWENSYGQIKRGQWCPKCARKRIAESRKHTIEDMQKLAESKGGKCLSKKYIDSKTKLIWQCSKEHIWEAIPDNVKRGHWCPYCARKRKL